MDKFPLQSSRRPYSPRCKHAERRVFHLSLSLRYRVARINETSGIPPFAMFARVSIRPSEGRKHNRRRRFAKAPGNAISATER